MAQFRGEGDLAGHHHQVGGDQSLDGDPGHRLDLKAAIQDSVGDPVGELQRELVNVAVAAFDGVLGETAVQLFKVGERPECSIAEEEAAVLEQAGLLPALGSCQQVLGFVLVAIAAHAKASLCSA